MAKQSIFWHEECLTNWADSLARKEERLATIMEEVEKARWHYRAYQQQIVEAKRRGLTGFDRERFLQKRNKH